MALSMFTTILSVFGFNKLNIATLMMRPGRKCFSKTLYWHNANKEKQKQKYWVLLWSFGLKQKIHGSGHWQEKAITSIIVDP